MLVLLCPGAPVTQLFFGSDCGPHDPRGVSAPPRSEWKSTPKDAKKQGAWIYAVTETVYQAGTVRTCRPVTVRNFQEAPVCEPASAPPPRDAPPDNWTPRRELTPDLLFRAYEIARDYRRDSKPSVESLALAIREVLS